MNGRLLDALGIETEGELERQDVAAKQQSEKEESMDDSDRMEWKRSGRGRVYKVPCQ